MSDRQQFERVSWFHGRIKAGRFPNSGHLVEEFEISRRTAHRIIEYMRERIEAPLLYDHARRGFCYSDTAFEIPGHWISETNILALSLAVRLASTIPDPALKDDLCRLINRMTGIAGKNIRACLQQVDGKVSVKNIEYALVNTGIFRQCVESLFAGRALHITYHSPHQGKTSTRTIQPLHLMHYMGSWHLIAWCSKQQKLRDFALARIREIAPTDTPIPVPTDLGDIKEYTRKHFGIMQSGTTSRVVLQFSPAISPWIAEQSWHPEQKTETGPDGSLRLEFPVADFRELVRTILSHGAEVSVIEPEVLKNLVDKEIERMAMNYFLS
ncbi:MAG: WYL domain-containing protein [Proteobacteria bacterium]|nr:WYL domain-containing protein [Pseudomonadota bacterium]